MTYSDSQRTRSERRLFSNATFLYRSSAEALRLLRVNDGEIRAGLGTAVEEEAVESVPASIRDDGTDERNQEGGFDIRDLLFDERD